MFKTRPRGRLAKRKGVAKLGLLSFQSRIKETTGTPAPRYEIRQPRGGIIFKSERVNRFALSILQELVYDMCSVPSHGQESDLYGAVVFELKR